MATNSIRKLKALQHTRLDALAKRINAEYKAVNGFLAPAAARALSCGALLVEAKALMSHKQWLPWLKANFEGDVRTAQRWMNVARKQPQVQAAVKNDKLSSLTIGGILALPKPEEGGRKASAPRKSTERSVARRTTRRPIGKRVSLRCPKCGHRFSQ